MLLLQVLLVGNDLQQQHHKVLCMQSPYDHLTVPYDNTTGTIYM